MSFRLSAVVSLLLICAPSYGDDAANRKTFDERKAERLAKHRAERRAREVRFEACIAVCRDGGETKTASQDGSRSTVLGAVRPGKEMK